MPRSRRCCRGVRWGCRGCGGAAAECGGAAAGCGASGAERGVAGGGGREGRGARPRWRGIRRSHRDYAAGTARSRHLLLPRSSSMYRGVGAAGADWARLPRSAVELPRSAVELPRSAVELPRSAVELPRAVARAARRAASLAGVGARAAERDLAGEAYEGATATARQVLPHRGTYCCREVAASTAKLALLARTGRGCRAVRGELPQRAKSHRRRLRGRYCHIAAPIAAAK